MEVNFRGNLSNLFPNHKFSESELEELKRSLIHLAKAIHLFALQEKEVK
jgi:hypothetical protein